MKTLTLLIALGIFLPLCTINAQDAHEIAQKSTDVIEFESIEMSSTLKIIDNKGNVRHRQISVATRKFGDVTKTLMKFISPPDVKGTSMLIYDYDKKEDDLWVYLPATRKTRRIISTEKGKSFMGSEFSNADMSKPNPENFNYKIIGEENFQGKTCWKLETVCKTEQIAKESGYNKKVSLVEKATFLSHKTDYYQSDGKLFKSILYKDFRRQSTGKYFSFAMIAENLLNGRKSEILVERFSLGTRLAENHFSPQSMEKL